VARKHTITTVTSRRIGKIYEFPETIPRPRPQTEMMWEVRRDSVRGDDSQEEILRPQRSRREPRRRLSLRSYDSSGFLP
jgi:hypothetical protein